MHRPFLVALLAANPAFVELSARDLEERGGFCVTTFSTAGALTTFLRLSPVDAVVLDTDMPGGSILGAVRDLRAHPRLASPLFSLIALTRADGAQESALLDAGADAVLPKPVSSGHLLAAMRKLLHSETRVNEAHYRRPGRSRLTRGLKRTGNVIHLRQGWPHSSKAS